VTVLLYLSYADEDSEIAHQVADRLSSADVTVYSPHDAADNPVCTISEPEWAIQQADVFLTLLSPNSLTSPSCRRERELAMYREQRSWDAGAPTQFVQVLQVRQTPYHRAGALRMRPWFDVTGQTAMEPVLSALTSKFEPSQDPPPGGHESVVSGPPTDASSGGFRNRDRELETIEMGCTGEDGDHFWLVIGPPQLGKSWFLQELSNRIRKRWLGRWDIELVDIRELSAEIVGDADAILRMMFGLGPHAATEERVVESIVARVIDDDEYRLCLLDSAELLDDSTVSTLRRYLSEINERAARSTANCRIALVVASRRDGPWKGITPAPRLRSLELTEFKVEIIKEALDKLAKEIRPSLTPRETTELALRVYCISEGLPALLAECLDWIRRREFDDLDRLDDRATFEEIAEPYIRDYLLSKRTLSGAGNEPSDEEQATLLLALAAVAPYRLLTTSHLSLNTEHGELHEAIVELEWSVQDLWAAVSAVDLFHQPRWESWLQLHTPIRRLLCRHWYPTEESVIQAHQTASDFAKSLLDNLSGSDLSRFFVECLWHQAQVLILQHADELDESLLSYARELSERLAPSAVFGPTSRDNAARCINDDGELQDALAGIPGLFERLIDTVRQPS
jgi:TIR domain